MTVHNMTNQNTADVTGILGVVHTGISQQISGGINVTDTSLNTLGNCIYPYYPQTHYVAPIQVRALKNGVIVQVGYIPNCQESGEYCFKDMKEASNFIKACMEKMLPK